MKEEKESIKSKSSIKEKGLSLDSKFGIIVLVIISMLSGGIILKGIFS